MHCTRAALSAVLLMSSVTLALSQDAASQDAAHAQKAMSEEEYLAPLARGKHPAIRLLETGIGEARSGLIDARALASRSRLRDQRVPALRRGSVSIEATRSVLSRQQIEQLDTGLRLVLDL